MWLAEGFLADGGLDGRPVFASSQRFVVCEMDVGSESLCNAKVRGWSGEDTRTDAAVCQFIYHGGAHG